MTSMFLAIVDDWTAQRVALALLHFLWQGALVWAALALLLRCLRETGSAAERKANVRYAVCCGGLLMMVGLPFATAWWMGPKQAVSINVPSDSVVPAYEVDNAPNLIGDHFDAAEPVAKADGAVVPTSIDAGTSSRSQSWLQARAFHWVFWIWIVGVSLLSMWHLSGLWLSRRLSLSGRKPPGHVSQLVRSLSDQMGIRRDVQVRQTPLSGPVLIGWLRPTLLLPVAVITGLTTRELESILAHELAHIKRHDYLVNILQSIVETVLFYHPAVWWVSRRMRVEREFCADDVALRICDGRETYARSLLKIAELGRVASATSVAASGGSLVDRIRRVLGTNDSGTQHRAPMSTALASLLVVGCLTGLFVAVGHSQGKDKNSEKKPTQPATNQAKSNKKTPSPVKPDVPNPSPAFAPDSDLMKAIDRVNREAMDRPFGKLLPPLTGSQVAASLSKFERKSARSDAEFELIKQIGKNGKLPKGTTLRQFFRYNLGTGMEHGSWVMLVHKRKGYGPLSIALRKHVLFSRPYTQLERFDRQSIDGRGGITTLNRLVTHFKNKPGFGKEVKRTVDYRPMAAQVRKALDAKDADAVMKLVCREKVATGLLARIKREVQQVMKKDIAAVTVRPKRYTQHLFQWQGFQIYGPNLPVEAYLSVFFKGQDDAQSVHWEVGNHEGQPQFVSHIRIEDQLTPRLGKKIPGPIVSSGVYLQRTPEFFEYASDVSAPASLPELTEANRELIRFPMPKASKAPARPAKKESAKVAPSKAIIAALRETEAAIKNLSVTTDYVKLQLSFLPVKEPVRMTLVTKAIVEAGGRAWNDTVGQQVQTLPNGEVRLNSEHTRNAFDGKVNRRLRGFVDGRYHTGSLSSHITWHGIDPREFTTHYFREPVSQLLKTKGANIVRQEKWDGRQVVVVDTSPSKVDRKYRFWIDAERKVVVRRATLVRYEKDQPFQEYTRVESRGHKQIAKGIWLPTKVKYESVEVTKEQTPEKLSWSYAGTNRDWKVNQKLADSQFQLDFPENVNVTDHRR